HQRVHEVLRQVRRRGPAEHLLVVLQREARVGEDRPPAGALDLTLRAQRAEEQPERGVGPQHRDDERDRAADAVAEHPAGGRRRAAARTAPHRGVGGLRRGVDVGDGGGHPRTSRFLAICRMLKMTSGTTSRKMNTAMAEPRPLLPKVNDWSYMRFASTWVSNFAPVIVRVMSKIFRVAIEIVVSTTTSEGRMLGIVIRQNSCHGDAPSSRAASMMSSGTALIEADRITIANPASIQTSTRMRKIVFAGASCRNRTGSSPRASITALRTPICCCPAPLYS